MFPRLTFSHAYNANARFINPTKFAELHRVAELSPNYSLSWRFIESLVGAYMSRVHVQSNFPAQSDIRVRYIRYALRSILYRMLKSTCRNCVNAYDKIPQIYALVYPTYVRLYRLLPHARSD